MMTDGQGGKRTQQEARSEPASTKANSLLKALKTRVIRQNNN